MRAPAAADSLLVFARCPEPGRVKTRLIPALGEEGATELHRRMLARTFHTAATYTAETHAVLEVWYDGETPEQLSPSAGTAAKVRPQEPGDLGERMCQAVVAAIREGARRTVLIGTDCPGLSTKVLRRAFDALKEEDLVLGPAVDGGYYLIGTRASVPTARLRRLFEGVQWGTSRVLEESLAAADREGLTYRLLDTLADVDRPRDLPVWEKVTGEQVRQSSQDRISVIVPTLNEAEDLSGVLDSVRGGEAYEVIVVDGGSDDRTVDIAESSGATVMRTRSGRGHQMNVGAAAAGGEILLFLHGDTQLPEGFAAHVRRILQVPGTAAGAFSFAVSPPFRGSRLLQRLVNWRSRRLEMPYGDQALFTRAHLFAEMGGFPDLPIMEDLEFVRRLKRLGKVRIAPAQVATSSRRWTKLGVWRTTLVNQLCIAAYYLKIPPSAIARLYGRSTGLSQS